MSNLIGTSTDPNIAGVDGSNQTGAGVIGTSTSGVGVWGGTDTSSGVGGMSGSGIGVHGVSTKAGQGVRGDCEAGVGVQGNSINGRAVEGNCPQGAGVVGASNSGVGVWGGSDTSTGVGGMSKSGHGVHGVSTSNHAVVGGSTDGVGVWGQSQNGEGVVAVTQSRTAAAIAGFNNNPDGTGAAIYGKKEGNSGHAGFFEGNVRVTQKIFCDQDICCTNADCAEDFDIADEKSAKPGTVMVLSDDGALHQSHKPYDKRVAGVISGAGEFKPGIVLDKRQSSRNRQPIALLGKVFCKVDAQFGAISVGDLLTTSPTRGYAMRADDPLKAFGAVIGKALRPLTDGQGLIPILIALQ